MTYEEYLTKYHNTTTKELWDKLDKVLDSCNNTNQELVAKRYSNLVVNTLARSNNHAT